MRSSAAFRAILHVIALVGAGIAGTTPALANPSINSAFTARYPASRTITNAGCDTCHGGSTANFNSYGRDVKAASGTSAERIVAVEGVDSDKEGNANLAEINAGAQPGWCAVAGCDNNGRTVPASVSPPLDPAAGQPPVANAGGPYAGTINVAISFDGSASRDPDGSVVSYLWNFGDGSTAPDPAPVHAYAMAGSYTVTLTVTDNDGLTHSASTTVQVADGTGMQPPVASAGGPYSGSVGSPLAFDGSGSSDPDGTIVSFDWTFGDGGSASGSKPMHVYSAAGAYTVTLTVTDDTGRKSTATTSVTIRAAEGGAGLYSTHCAGCHGDPWGGPAVDQSLPGLKRVAGSRACSIKGAIFGTSVFPQGVPDMVAHGNQQLTTAEVDAIADHLNSRPASGEQRYVSACAGCHGNDGRGGRIDEGVVGEGAKSIGEAIREDHAMQFLGCLPASDIDSVATFLSSSKPNDRDSGDGGGGSAGAGTLLGLLMLGLWRARPRPATLREGD